MGQVQNSSWKIAPCIVGLHASTKLIEGTFL